MAALLSVPHVGVRDSRLQAKLNEPRAQIAVELLRQGIEAYGGVKLSPRTEFGVQASAPWSARSVRDVAVKGVFKFKFW